MEKKKKLLKIAILFYFIISPVFDTVFLYNRYITLLRVSVLLIFAVATIILYKDSRKSMKYLIVYYLAMGGYLLINYLHSKGFNSLVPGNFGYSLVSEATVLLKLCMPFTILFILKYQDIRKKDFFKVINAWVFLIAGSIVVLNLFGYSLSSYGGELTGCRIFDWSVNTPIKACATKGFFAYANQEAIILIMLLVLSIYEMLFINKKGILAIMAVSISSLMLGTRISSIGGLLVVIVMLLVYIGYSILFKKKISKISIFLVVVSVLWGVMLPLSPGSSRMDQIANASDTIEENKVIEGKSADVTELSSLKYIEDNYNTVIFEEKFYRDYYPYEYDTEFWVELVDMQDEGPRDYREMEIAIISRVWEIDNRKTNYLFGISNSRIQNIVNIERDFLLQLYAFGIIGLIVALSYYAFAFFRVFRAFFKSKTFMDLSLLMCLILFLVASYASGNSLNFLATTVPCAFILTNAGKYND